MLFVLGVFAAIPAKVCQAAAFQNGSFELNQITTQYAGLNYVVNSIPVVSLPGWVSTSNTTSPFNQNLLIRSTYDHISDGSQAVVFNGDNTSNVSLAQTFDTTAGASYQVQFDLTAQSLGIDGTISTTSNARLALGASGSATQSYPDPTVPNASGVFPYVTEQYNFTATSSSTTLTFSQSGGTDVSPVLDNVRVGPAPTATPLPLFNTGVDSNGTPLPDGTLTDPHWTLISIPNTSQTSTLRVRTSVGGYPVTGWLGDDTSSAWIGPNNTSQVFGAVGNYEYRTTFTAPAGDTQATITGRWASDDIGSSILLDGVLVSTGDVGSGTWSTFSFTGTVSPGQQNTLDFIVNNAGSSDNPTGLRVEFASVTFVPEPGGLSLLTAAGFALAGRRQKRAISLVHRVGRDIGLLKDRI